MWLQANTEIYLHAEQLVLAKQRSLPSLDEHSSLKETATCSV